MARRSLNLSSSGCEEKRVRLSPQPLVENDQSHLGHSSCDPWTTVWAPFLILFGDLRTFFVAAEDGTISSMCWVCDVSWLYFRKPEQILCMWSADYAAEYYQDVEGRGFSWWIGETASFVGLKSRHLSSISLSIWDLGFVLYKRVAILSKKGGDYNDVAQLK